MKTEYANEYDKALKLATADDWNGANDAIGGFGVEHIECAGRMMRYINTGDTYNTTICQELEPHEFEDRPDSAPWIGDWGTWYEETENEHCAENDVIRCGYCGEFTPIDKQDWRDTVCESCGNLVGG